MNRNSTIFDRHKNGESVVDLAREYDLSRTMVYRILKEQSDLVAGGADLPARMEAAKLALLKARAENEELAAQLAELRLQRMRGECIPRAEVREAYARIMAPYRQAIREIDRRYGPDAARLLIDAERSALTH